MTKPRLSPEQRRLLDMLLDEKTQYHVALELGVKETAVASRLRKLRLKFKVQTTLLLLLEYKAMLGGMKSDPPGPLPPNV